MSSKNDIKLLKEIANVNASEELFDIPFTPPHYMCPDIDEILDTLGFIYDKASHVDKDEDDSKSLLDRLNNIELHTNTLDCDVESIRNKIIVLRNWGESWKTLAKSLLENSSNIESYVRHDFYDIIVDSKKEKENIE